MRRVGKWLFNLVAGVSLVLCVAAIVLWLRSYRTADNVFLAFLEAPLAQGASFVPARTASTNSNRGMLESHFESTRALGLPPVLGPGYHVAFRRLLLVRWAGATTMGQGPRAVSFGRLYSSGYDVVFRHWLLAVAFAALPGLQLGRAVSRRGLGRERSCRKCRYNLTANVSGVCPECGTAIEKGVAAK